MGEELLYQIAITRIPRVGAVIAKTLISYCGGAEAVFRARRRELMRIPGIGEGIAEHITRQDVLWEAEAELEFLEKSGTRALYYLHKDYPTRLKQYPDCPVVLYYQGVAELDAPRTVGVVGTRRPSARGTARCDEIVAGLKKYGATIISGLAFGIDIAAHRRCLVSEMPTIGVLGHGLKWIYPAEHRSAAMRMKKKGGLLTEHLSSITPEREHFPMRNRIIAGLCDALLVVETGRGGGSMISAEIANSYHKEVFAVPGRPDDKQSEGCNYLIKTHKAALAECAEDIAYQMLWDEAGAQAGVQQLLFTELSPEEKIIVDLLRQAEAMHVDNLVVKAGLNYSVLAASLLNLECQGIIKSLPGSRYRLLTR